MTSANSFIKPIALYLPQFHTIPENDQWWGEGFTEWTNVRKAKPVFPGHYQPHKPLDDNYYDLSDIDVMRKQAALAKSYGLYGFCFYHYWFNGKLLLEKPIEKWLTSDIDFNYCLSWANENWTRRWDGKDKEVLMEQKYDTTDDLNHINYLIKFFQDPRYIKIGNSPVLLMYRSELHPSIKNATEIWRNEVKKAGFENLYLIRMENFYKEDNPEESGFDAGMEFAPDVSCQGLKIHKRKKATYLFNKFLHVTGLKKNGVYENGVYDYITLRDNMVNRDIPAYPYFRCACPSWDNAARRRQHARIFVNSNPKLFGEWIKELRKYTLDYHDSDRQLLFINAWNEWAEGAHLEPDKKNGFEFLEALKENIQ